jgi:uncharacterized membrane protein YfcA
MAPVFALAELGIAAGTMFLVIASFKKRQVTLRWWLVLGVAALAGAIGGAWLGFGYSYQPSYRGL